MSRLLNVSRHPAHCIRYTVTTNVVYECVGIPIPIPAPFPLHTRLKCTRTRFHNTTRNSDYNVFYSIIILCSVYPSIVNITFDITKSTRMRTISISAKFRIYLRRFHTTVTLLQLLISRMSRFSVTLCLCLFNYWNRNEFRSALTARRQFRLPLTLDGFSASSPHNLSKFHFHFDG